ncbi:MAG TPA: bifunctional rhamnulose-1-phosphate aldolase/short-chain dehydrogenase [Fimbriimonadaceae bacterium]|mgnify:CR=1 FL=1|nr:bifunctional rhamnulose-1-phosphate aldolase/short-chain dehydrogenase [Fimbriimonadaceae bacterium]
MASTTSDLRVPNLWSATPADPVDELVYASNLLGSDPRVTNFGGGNTSSKVRSVDPLTGEEVEVLWVKASGGDLGSAKRANFASLYLDKVLGLESRYSRTGSTRAGLSEDEVVPLYGQSVYNLNPAAPSIDTPLHAFVPFRAVSHMHADSVIAVAAAADSETLTKEIYGDEMGFLPWKRPGIELGLMLRDLIVANPNIKGAMMQSHGFICWADTWEECYALTIRMINQAAEFIEQRDPSKAFGAVVRDRHPSPESVLIDLLPVLRGKVAFEGQRLIAAVDQSEPVLDFLSRAKMDQLTALGTSCPDHFLRTKIRPMVLNPLSTMSVRGEGAGGGEIDVALDSFRQDYAAYYSRCKRADSPAMRNPNPSVVLVPGVGMIAFGKNAQEAKVTGQFYRNAIEVMRGAETMSRYTALDEQEAFDIEYWLLEEAKLRRMPPEKELSRQIALITGAGSGIGRATALKMANLGAHCVLLDINETALSEAEAEVTKINKATSLACDVTQPGALTAAFRHAILTFGGVDIVVANAGNARRGTVAETSAEDYNFLSDLLMKAYFDTLAEATRLLVKQGTGGSIVLVGSKNGVAAGSNAALYSAAKAFELHLMRVTAADFAKHGIRCNAINPDGVVTGSAIWSDAWKDQTAAALGIKPEELVNYYAKRSLLGTVVTPDDCAEAICWLAGPRASRTTGCVIPVDGGNKEGFLR